MKQSERACIFRIVSDLIKADAIIDTREIEKLDAIKEKFSIKNEDEIIGSSLTLAEAVKTFLGIANKLQDELITTFNSIAMSDNFCAREEALLLMALHLCMNPIDTSSISVDPTQILYVESDFDNDINWEINEKFREITSEARLAGFDFVYLPQIAAHYRAIPENEFLKMSGFLYPKASKDKLETVVNQLYALSTSEFCKDQLAGKLGIKEFSAVSPSLMIKIGDSVSGIGQ